jgi:hypothetical protein
MDTQNDHLTDQPMGRNLYLARWHIYLDLYTHEVGCPSDITKVTNVVDVARI